MESLYLAKNIISSENYKGVLPVQDEDMLTLEEFVKLPDTADFQLVLTDQLAEKVRNIPYIHIGEKFANGYTILYANEKYMPQIFSQFGGDYLMLSPKVLSPVDSFSNESAGITQVLGQPFLDITGQGVVVGIIDTGIDYTQNAFRFEDGSTKILSLWDQTLDGSRSGVYFGTTFDKEQINSALRSERPLDAIPSIDEDGHGTFLASVAAGRSDDRYSGAAPSAELICVKLRRARDYYIRRYLLDSDTPTLYESTDFMLGIKYVLETADRMNRPAVICIGMGSNTSAHDGNTYMEDYISFVTRRSGYVFVTAAGNEANARHHTIGRLTEDSKEGIDIKVGRQGASFGVLTVLPAFDRISVGVTSPTGETVFRRPFSPGQDLRQKLILSDTTIHMRFSRDTNNTIWVGFENPSEGIWEITLYGDHIIDGTYQAWLPITGQVDPTVEFLSPSPDYTVVYPSAAARAIICGAYNSFDNSLLISSSRGPTRQPRLAPDITAPGAMIGGYFPEGSGTMTGTSAAAAVCTGAAALLLEWGVVQGELPDLNGDLLRSLLIGGAVREQGLEYPNNKWGYGKINLYRTFEYLAML